MLSYNNAKKLKIYTSIGCMFFKKDFIVKYLLIVSFWLLPVLANAACWEEFATGNDKSIHYIDACSIAIDGVYKKAWFKTELQIPEENSDGKTYDSSKQLSYFNCKNRKSALAQFTNYYIDDVVNSSSTKIEKSAFDEVIPDSIGEAKFERACSTKKTKKTNYVLNRSLQNFDTLDDSKKCWSYVFTEKEKYEVYVNQCSITKSDVTKGDITYTTYMKMKNVSNLYKGKILSKSSDKEYYDTIKSELSFDCNNWFFQPFWSNYYRNEAFVAQHYIPDDLFIEFTPEKTKIINDVLCPSLSQKSTTQIKEVKVIEKTETDELSTKFCWKDIHSNKDIDIYYDNCNFNVDKNSKHITSWIRKVTSKNYKSEIFGEYNEVVKKIDFDCISFKGADIQSYYYSPEPANKLTYEEKNKEITFTAWPVTFDKGINSKVFETLCKL